MIEKHEKLKRALLWLPAKIYEFAVRLRVAAYETGYLKSKRLSATVISVGNITLGGTGKTPLVEYIARYLNDEGHPVAILTRGFSRKSRDRRVLNIPAVRSRNPAETFGSGDSRHATGALPAKEIPADPDARQKTVAEFGDEPLMMARDLADVPIIIDKNRFAAGEWAQREAGAEILVLDDAYQHLGLERDLNLLLLDATDPLGGFEMPPFGRLREPLYGLKRADVVIITRAHRPFDQSQTLRIIKLFCGEKVPVMYFYSTLVRLRHLSTGEAYEAKQFAGWNAALMCGIGNPHAFADDVLQIGVNIVSESFFADHHQFSQQDVERVNQAARDAGADAILVTEKDAIRLDGLDLGDIPIYAAQLEIQSDDDVRLKSLLLRTASQKR